MVALALKRFGGTAPTTDQRLLPSMMGTEAINVAVASGALEPWNGPAVEHLFDQSWKRAYRFDNQAQDEAVWLGLPHEHASVARSPLANDTTRRLYWTWPGNKIPFWNTWQRIKDGVAPYNLGTVQPPTDIALGVSVSGGDPDIPASSRSYVYTWINEFGEESAPNKPSPVVSGPPDGLWAITGLPASVPPNPAGANYPPITRLRLYRTVTGENTGAQYFEVTTWDLLFNTPPDPVLDVNDDAFIAGNLLLDTAEWGNPVEFLDGILVMPGGMMVGFTDNTVHFSEPSRPHTWPAGYDQSLHFDIVGMALWHQSLTVLTQGFPSVGTGSRPSLFTFRQVQASEPCLSRGSIVTDLSGVYYSSQDGLIRLNESGIVNLTYKLINEDQWISDFKGDQIMGARHKSMYVAMNEAGGFAVDFAEARRGVVRFSSFSGATTLWSDEETGATYVMKGDTVYRWDDRATHGMIYRWRSKLLYQAKPGNFGACQIELHPDVETTIPVFVDPLSNGDTSIELPNEVNAKFTIFAGAGPGRKIFTRNLAKRLEIFRLPSGFKAFDWQVEVVSKVPIYAIELGSTMAELKKVPADQASRLMSLAKDTDSGDDYGATA